MSPVSMINPESASLFPVFSFMNASSTRLITLPLLSNSPLTVKFPVTVTSPTMSTPPSAPVNCRGVFVTPPSLTVNFKSLSCEVCATVTSLLSTVIVSSCESPMMTPPSASTVSAPVVLSGASALKKLPPAISVAEVLDVPDTSMCAACVFVPSNTAPSVEFNVNPALIEANPVCVALGVNVSLESIATLVLPAYMELTTLLPPELANVSIFHPESVCPDV